MLKNEKYVGDTILQKTVTANSITFKRKPNEGEAPMYYIKNKLLLNRSILASFAATLKMVNEVKISGGQLKELNTEIDGLLNQEHVLLELSEKGVADKAMLLVEHEELIGKLCRMRAERNEIIHQIEGEDDRLRKTKELIDLFDKIKDPIEGFDEEILVRSLTSW
jgi:hypothetical protein